MLLCSNFMTGMLRVFHWRNTMKRTINNVCSLMSKYRWQTFARSSRHSQQPPGERTP